MFKPRYILLIVLLANFKMIMAQEDLYVKLTDAKKNPSKVKYLHVDGDQSSLDTLNNYITRFGHLSGIAIEGKVTDDASLWKSLYQLRLLEQLIFLNNDLSNIQLGGSSSTIKELWISGSKRLSSATLTSTFTQCKYLQVLRINEMDDKVTPATINTLKLLRYVQFTNCKWNFDDIASQLKYCKKLRYLDLSENRFQIIGRHIKQLPDVRYLDLSGNELTEISSRFKSVKGLDSLILNRNQFTNIEPIAQLIQNIPLSYVAFDEDTVVNKDDISYLLPGKEIVWSDDKITDNKFILPKGHSGLDSYAKIDSISFYRAQENFSGGSAVKLLSPAYIEYDQLYFPNPLKKYDSLSFAKRYLDSSYIYTNKINYQNNTPEGYYYPLKYDKAHRNWYKKKRLKKIVHPKHSYVLISILDSPKEMEGSILFAVNINDPESKREDLKAYSGIVWEALGYSDRKLFEQELIQQKAWSDVRFTFDQEKTEYRIELKGRFENTSVVVQPRKSTDLTNLKDMDKTGPKMADRYTKALGKSAIHFNKELIKTKQKLLRPYDKELKSLWGIVEAKMSDEEKAWTKDNWLEYYKKVKANEFYLLANKQLGIQYLSRYLESQHFLRSNGLDFYVGQKWVNFELLNKDSTMLDIKDYCMIDMDRKLVKYYKATNDNQILYEPFHKYMLITQLKDGRVVYLDSRQLLALKDSSKLVIDNESFIDSNISNAMFFKIYVLSIMNKLNY